MDFSKLNKRITIQKIIPISTKNGFDDEGWVDIKTLWASVNNLWGKEFWSAKAIEAEKTVEFVVRYSKELEAMDSKKYRIYWNDKVFNITFIDNIKYENKWIKIKAMEVIT